MWVILLEALGAAALLIFIVWWTMFSGRVKGERKGERRGKHTGEPTQRGDSRPEGRDDR